MEKENKCCYIFISIFFQTLFCTRKKIFFKCVAYHKSRILLKREKKLGFLETNDFACFVEITGMKQVKTPAAKGSTGLIAVSCVCL